MKLVPVDRQSFARFLASGAFNTLLTYALYAALLFVLPYKWSYTISYSAGVVLAFCLNRFFVFKSHRGTKSILLFPLIYVAQYTLSIIIVWLWVEHFHLNVFFAPLAAIIITVPVTYILSKVVFVGIR